MNLHTSSDSAAARGLRALMQGRVVSRGDDDYSRTRKIWNGAVENEPALFAVCESAVDVQAAVRIARQHGLALSVRGGGHDWAGRALQRDGLVIDLSRMRQVVVDPQARVATVAGGAMANELAAAAGAHGLVAALGNCGTVGVAGLTLGGGYGPLSGSCGLAADNLLGAEIVLADGRRVTAGPDAEPDLFWALRGGGGNFGVVTSLRIRLHPAPDMLAGSLIYDWSEAGKVLRRYAAFAPATPDELGVSVGMMSGPDGEPVFIVVPLWNGERRQRERVMEGLRALGSPLSVQVGPATYSDMLARFDAWVEAMDGHHWELRTRWLPALTAEAADVIIAAKARAPSPDCSVFWHHFHGAATRVVPAATAFGMRNEHLMIEILAGWTPDGDGAAHRRWAQDLWQSLAPFALPGGYANLLGPNDREQAAGAFGGNAARLRMLKRRFDPDGVFASALLLPAE
ncbi:FAD-binding oxidoreductase [Bradyrhizobium ivorense]|uniref:FAD-binding oxidoreductase n=1 Tax=Bradyrhizobium ivorense TaxID=2511166 RepID=UPI0010AF2C58|nr:FAD-binding oxidoreductase [Bradyrhizobium ivorense]VIO77733.1 putative FAD-linked oxidoreductase YvdP [Bradyrhizobium ivorense]